jgi:cell division protein FtsI/penicillin-binding protein 2
MSGSVSGLRAGMIRPCQSRRLVTCGFLLVLAFGVLGYRLVDLQVLRHEELREQASKAWQKRVEHPTRRGRIYDARGELLATSVPVKTVCADPMLVGTNEVRVARVLARVLGLDEVELAHRVRPRKVLVSGGREVDLRYVVLKRRVPVEVWDELRREIGDLPRGAVFTEPVDREMRFYPNGRLAAHVLGFSGYREQPVAGEREEELVGKSGIEAGFNPVLSGIAGWREILRDVHQREIVSMRPSEVASRAGLSVVLTIDAGLQHIVESEIEEAFVERGPLSITSLVVRPRTGEILAMANLPTFDPNEPGAVPPGNLRNRSITDVAEPGSTFKALAVTAALNEGVVRLGDEFFCENGYWAFKGRRMRDVGRYGTLTVEEIIVKSSNIGAAKIGIQLGAERLHRYVKAFGIGEPTRIPLGGEVTGQLHDLRSWSGISVAWIPMGHEVSATPLQMVMAVSAIANEGWLMRPMLVSALIDEVGNPVVRFEPTPVRRVVGEAAAAGMVRALTRAVAEGTGRRAQLEHYEVAGKTGTAQKIVNGGYSHEEHVASFIGFFPAHDPELCISVVIDRPTKGSYGGETAAPVFQRIAERAAAYLGVPPTRGSETPMFTGNRPVGREVKRVTEPLRRGAKL